MRTFGTAAVFGVITWMGLTLALRGMSGAAVWAQDEPPQLVAPADVVPLKPDEGAAPGAKPRIKIPQSLDEYFFAGGALMYPIALCSFITIVFGVERLVMLRTRRVIPRDFVTRFIQHLEQNNLDRKTALKLCEENGSPVAHVFEHGVRKWGKPSVEVEQAIIDGGERQVGDLRKNLRILNAVSTLAPLLGLLGTVLGMIEVFYTIARTAGAAKAGDFAGGVGVALITTASGLFVAIPAMIVYLYFVGRVDRLVMDMDLAAQKVVNLISAEGQAAAPPRQAAPKERRATPA